MPTLALRIDNMHCGACVRRVMQTLNGLPGTHTEEVQIGNARITTDASAEQVLRALDAAGYPAHIHSGGA